MVTVDGRTIPGAGLALQPGSYTVIFAYPGVFGAVPHRQVILVGQGGSTEVRHFLNVGSLRYASNPPAQVFVDGQLVGSSQTGRIEKMVTGSHRLLVKRDGYPELAADFSVAPNETKELEIVYNFVAGQWQAR